MKQLFGLLVGFLLSCNLTAQTKILTADSSGQVYVLFIRPDSVAVVFQGNNTAFTTDGIFAKDFAAFDLKLKGFLAFDGLKQSIEAASSKGKMKEVVVGPIIPPVVNVDLIDMTDKVSVVSTNLFPKGNHGFDKARYIVEPVDWGIADNNRNEIRITGMDGYDFAPIVANQGKNIWTYNDWKQGYISVSGKRDIWKDVGGTYFLKPKGYFTDMSYNLMDFDLRFPEFLPPKGKIIVIEPTPERDISAKNYLKKGVTSIKNGENSKGYVFVSDDWLWELGCPMAYTSTKDAMDKWCAEIDENVLLNNFIEKVYYPNRDKGYVMLNWEAVGNRWVVRQDKIINCLKYWAEHEHTAQMSLASVQGIGFSRPIFQAYNQDFSEILEFGGSLEELTAKYNNYINVDFTYAKYVEVAYIGGYQNYPIEDGIIHCYLTELLLNKKYNSSKKAILGVWFDQEAISTFNLDFVRVESEAGTYLAQTKMKVAPSTAFNWGVWSIVGDGIDCWSDPNTWSENKADWGWGSRDVNWKELPQKHGQNLSKFPAQPMKAIDWMMSGVWAMSENKDIVEDSGEWKFVRLPTKAFHQKSVMIAYKIKGSEALVLALDGFGKIDGETVHSFDIGGKNYKIKTFGRYTSVIRMTL